MSIRFFGAVVMTVALSFAGCAPPPPTIVAVEGVVTLDGQPLPKARVVFYPQISAPNEYIAQGVTDDEGHFSLTCRGLPGACVAENLVAVSSEEIPPELTPEGKRAELQAYFKTLKNRPIPDKYKTQSSSDVRVAVSAAVRDVKIELKR